MEKRLLLAIGLSLLVLTLWSNLMLKSSPTTVTAPTVSAISTFKQADAPQAIQIGQKQDANIPIAQDYLTFERDFGSVVFIETQAAIKEVTFNQYQKFQYPLKYGLLLNDGEYNYKKQSSSENEIVFVQSDENKKIIKRFIFSKVGYSVDLEIEIQNLSNKPLKMNLPLVLGVFDFNNKEESRFQDVSIETTERTLRPGLRKDAEFNDIRFLGMRDRYFCTIVEPLDKGFSGFVKKINANESEVGLLPQETIIAPAQKLVKGFRVYIGPQDSGIIGKIKPEWTVVMYYGTFDIIAKVLLQVLEVLFKIFHNWGVAIIVLSLLVYVVLFPLSMKQMRSMKQMQALQPLIESLRETCKDNPQKLNKETLELYKKHKVNPFSGCLPMILQLPIFFSLYQAIMRLISLKGAHFLWIKDLSQPDRLFLLPTSLPVISNEFNVLPILMAIGMFVQQKASATSTSSASAEQQKIMMIVFPIMFGFIFYRMPSGLVLYWFVNSALMLAYQLKLSKNK
ncbi:MAG: membrane protein insertase YidC [Candidatus Omnitrophota bacterium]|jgi:YidC/Oxa1 family membrane protein insertase